MSYKLFDICQLIRAHGVKLMSGPPGINISPHGNWFVVGNIKGGDLVLAKEGTIIVVPVSDVRKICDYDIEKVISEIKRMKVKEKKDGEEGQEGPK